MQGLGIDPLGQMLSARELLRRPQVSYHQVSQLAHNVFRRMTLNEMSGEEDSGSSESTGTHAHDAVLPVLPAPIAEEVELQVKYESYVRKQEQIVHRTRRMEEHQIPETIDYTEVQHLRTPGSPEAHTNTPPHHWTGIAGGGRHTSRYRYVNDLS